MKEVNGKAKIRVITILCVIVYLFLQVLMITNEIRGMVQFNGVIMACQFGACLIIVWVDYKKGIIISLGAMALSVFLVVRAMLMGNVIGPLPGLFNSLIYIVVTLMINSQFRKREKQAFTDYETGLMNRRGMDWYLKTETTIHQDFAVYYVYLSNFRKINDKYTHHVGNIFLNEIAERLQNVVGKKGKVFRLSGSGFGVVASDAEKSLEIGNTILSELRKKIVVSKEHEIAECFVDTYLGIVRYPIDINSRKNLAECAETAMQKARECKAKEPYFYNKEIQDEQFRQTEVEQALKDGLAKNLFYLVYQPQYELNGKKLRGFEALLRLKMPDGRSFSPGEFIPIAEKTGYIAEIDYYVIKKALNEFRAIVKASPKDITLSINVSAKNMSDPNFADYVKSILSISGFPAYNLEIELTEYSLVDSYEIASENIRQLRAMGVQIALDDFGTGYTSLSYLFTMTIDLLKIDKTLSDDITNKDENRQFIENVIAMGHSMNCNVIAEGIESEEQINVLVESGCDMVQGFVWGRPMSLEAAKSIIK